MCLSSKGEQNHPNIFTCANRMYSRCKMHPPSPSSSSLTSSSSFFPSSSFPLSLNDLERNFCLDPRKESVSSPLFFSLSIKISQTRVVGCWNSIRCVKFQRDYFSSAESGKSREAHGSEARQEVASFRSTRPARVPRRHSVSSSRCVRIFRRCRTRVKRCLRFRSIVTRRRRQVSRGKATPSQFPRPFQLFPLPRSFSFPPPSVPIPRGQNTRGFRTVSAETRSRPD